MFLDSDQVVPIGLTIGFFLLSVIASVFRSALIVAEARGGAEDLAHAGVLQKALNANLRHPAKTTFTLYFLRVIFDGVVVGALIIYLIKSEARQAEFVASLLGGLTVLVLMPALLSPLSRRYANSIALIAAPGAIILDILIWPLARRLYNLALWFSGASDTLPELATELAARFNRVLIPLEKQVNPPDEQELEMIYAILQMEETAVRDVMVPRPDLVAIEISEDVSKAVALMREAGHSRIVAYAESIDHVVGILHARDILRLAEPSETPVTMQDLLRPALFVPEGKRLDALLREFQRQRAHMAIVVDEYGGTAGLVTLEDILEEIVGEIVDEFDEDEPEIQIISEDEVILDARVNLSFLKEHFDVDIEGDGFDTIGGLVYNQLGKIPSQGDQAVADGLRVEVLSTEGRRITKVRVVRKPEPKIVL